MLTVQMPLLAAQPYGVQTDSLGERLHPARPSSITAFDSDSDLVESKVERHPAAPRSSVAGSDTRP